MIIAVRNAIHHRDHPLFRSLQRRLHTLAWRVVPAGKSPPLYGAPIRMSHHVRLDDLDARLDPSRASPYLDTSLGGTKAADRFTLINSHLRLPVIRRFGSEHRYPEDQTYLDLTPIFVSAISKVFKAMKAADINFNEFDAQTYLAPFTSELEIARQLELQAIAPARLGPTRSHSYSHQLKSSAGLAHRYQQHPLRCYISP
ncbi:hypothetical protein [Mesorhizobium sp. M1322]|uniref:hypothetical protein n=1 Tax=Mesorhizobium sp. M1322 TaxID=2957081 RepID=UPI00333D68ED